MLTKADIEKQHEFNRLAYSDKDVIENWILTNVNSHSDLEEVIRALIQHNKQADYFCKDQVDKRLQSVLNFDLIPVHYNTLDDIGNAMAFSLDPDELKPDMRGLERLCKLVTQLQNEE